MILSLLAMVGILAVTSQEGINGDVKGLKLLDDYKERNLMIVSDGLYQIRTRIFNELID